MCGQEIPETEYCSKCGKDITPAHECGGKSAFSILHTHFCRGKVLLERYCSYCGVPFPEPEFCTRCGADITPTHSCGTGIARYSQHYCPRKYF